MKKGPISQFIAHHYRHFNAAALVDAAQGYVDLLASDGKMFVTIAGAMSTAELGLSLAEMIRHDKVHGICCTGANLEEEYHEPGSPFPLQRVPNYRDLTPQQEWELLEQGPQPGNGYLYPRRRSIPKNSKAYCSFVERCEAKNERYFPHEYMYKLLLSKVMLDGYELMLKTVG
jgi:deoxyhypusine synthase